MAITVADMCTWLTDFVFTDVQQRLPLWSSSTIAIDQQDVIVSSETAHLSNEACESGSEKVAVPTEVERIYKVFIPMYVNESAQVDENALQRIIKLISATAKHIDLTQRCSSSSCCDDAHVDYYMAFVDNGGTISYYECETAAPHDDAS